MAAIKGRSGASIVAIGAYLQAPRLPHCTLERVTRVADEHDSACVARVLVGSSYGEHLERSCRLSGKYSPLYCLRFAVPQPYGLFTLMVYHSECDMYMISTQL